MCWVLLAGQIIGHAVMVGWVICQYRRTDLQVVAA